MKLTNGDEKMVNFDQIGKIPFPGDQLKVAFRFFGFYLKVFLGRITKAEFRQVARNTFQKTRKGLFRIFTCFIMSDLVSAGEKHQRSGQGPMSAISIPRGRILVDFSTINFLFLGSI